MNRRQALLATILIPCCLGRTPVSGQDVSRSCPVVKKALYFRTGGRYENGRIVPVLFEVDKDGCIKREVTGDEFVKLSTARYVQR